jgi:7-keto-8-aminopelargonate synthetase-like enzyme
MDSRLHIGVVEALARYGTQFSSSRTYMSAPPYAELEALLSELFGGPTLVASSTSLGHQGALPVLVGEEDAVILDQQVHHSVQQAANLVRLQGAHVEVVRHNRLDLLEERIQALQGTHRRIWYLADGIYSMYAEVAPLAGIEALMARYPKLHFYVDDSHGMSWTGPHGRGYVLGRMPIRERMVVAASLNKSFASAGGALIFPDEETRRRVRAIGGPMIFSGPVQPPMLGAALASARLHLSDEIVTLQTALQARIRHFNQQARALGLPLVADSDAPVRFIGVGTPQAACEVGKRLLEDGFYTNVSIFPAVPMKQAGIRMTVTVHQTLEDIEAVLQALARHLPDVLAAEGRSVADVRAVFGLPAPVDLPSAPTFSAQRALELVVSPAPALRVEKHRTIETLAAEEWDALLGQRGSFTWQGLRFLEATFGHGQRPENHWNFHYYVVRDHAGKPVAATFFTDALWKDDMLAPAEVSRKVEAIRASDPTFLTSRTFAMGSLLTEGDHLYLDRAADWQGALKLLLEAVAADQGRCRADALVLRDLDAGDAELGEFLRGQGFAKFAMPASHVLEIGWADEEGYLGSLRHKHRHAQRHKILPFNDRFEVEVYAHGGRQPDADELAHLHALYRNVQARSLELNVFALPDELFGRMLQFPGWEIVALKLAPAYGGQPNDRPVGFLAGFAGPQQYAAMMVGLDYRYVETHGLYRQLLRQMIRRAEHHQASRLLLGMGAAAEKQRLGAKSQERCGYIQASDLFNFEVLAQLQADVSREKR